MSTKIKGAEYPLSKIFSAEFEFIIPSYQRPYAWTEEETETLFQDLYNFYQEDVQKEDSYFLGSVVLVKEEDKPRSEVIDGQQRLTTLTILFAVLATFLPGNEQFRNYIIEPGNEFEGLKPKPRLTIRPRDNSFFNMYIQNMDVEKLMQLNADGQDTEAKNHIIKNARQLLKNVSDAFHSESEIKAFCMFLIQRCFLVAVSTPSTSSAFRVFSVMNNRGMSLLPTDIIKADIIGVIPEEKQHKYTERWEEIEIELTRSGFNDLFSQIRMVKMKTKARNNLQEEFQKFVLPNVTGTTAMEFFDNVLEPYSLAYNVIKGSCYSSMNNAAEVNDTLRWLNRIDNSDWVPVAMSYYAHNQNQLQKLPVFLKKLERLAAYMRATSWDVNHRIERYARILNEIETLENGDIGETIELMDSEKASFIERLNSDIYKMTSNKRNYLILRLDSFVSDGAAAYDYKVLTIEHILPQTVGEGSQWEETWPDTAEREKWVHKIGNLIPLAKRTNSEAQNYDFEVKKEKYFKSKSGVTSYVLATQVLNYSTWTPRDVEERQQKLINAYIKGWELA